MNRGYGHGSDGVCAADRRRWLAAGGRRLAVVMMLALLLAVPAMQGGVSAAAKPTLGASGYTISMANTKTLKVKNLPAKAKVTWKSSDTKIAKVSQKGVVTGVKAGSATVTAKVKKGAKTYRLKAAIQVTEPVMSLSSVTISDLESEVLHLHKHIKNATVTWKSSDKSVVKIIKADKDYACRLDPQKAGQAQVTATVKTKKIATMKSKTLTYTVPVTVTASNMSWNLQDGVLTVTGEGDMPDFLDAEYAYNNGYTDERYAVPKWELDRPEIKKVVIGEGITSVGNNAFDGHPSITEVVLPSTLQRLGYQAFENCGVQSLVIPEGVEVLTNAFNAADHLTSVTLPQSLTTLDTSACHAWTSMAEIILPDGVTSIGNRAFQSDSKLQSIQLPASLQTIEENAFEGCTSLTEIRIPAGTLSIGDRAFQYCHKLTDVYFPASLTGFGQDLFWLAHTEKTLTIHAPAGSPAQQYAEENGFRFEAE